MASFAIPSDLGAIWRDLSDADAQLVNGWIDLASQMIRDDVPDVDGLSVDQRIEAGSLSEQTVRNTVVAMVRRVLVLNPQGARQQGAGPFTVTLDPSISSSELHITEREMQRLTGHKRGSGQRAFTISMGSPVFRPGVW